jgi:hypothetical protein
LLRRRIAEGIRLLSRARRAANTACARRASLLDDDILSIGPRGRAADDAADTRANRRADRPSDSRSSGSSGRRARGSAPSFRRGQCRQCHQGKRKSKPQTRRTHPFSSKDRAVASAPASNESILGIKMRFSSAVLRNSSYASSGTAERIQLLVLVNYSRSEPGKHMGAELTNVRICR